MNRYENLRLIRMVAFSSLLLLLFSCAKEQDPDIGLYLCNENGELEPLSETDTGVIVTTTPVSEIATSTATSGGKVTNNSSTVITARGVCWSTQHNPKISGSQSSHTTDGSGAGNFISNMIGLSAGTTYYVRAYATNSSGTEYGVEVSFITTTIPGTKPTVTTTSVNNVGANSATLGGKVTSSGSSSVTTRGVCWSTSHYPTANHNHYEYGSGLGSFSITLNGYFSANTTYYVRAYATNSSGTAYGDEVSFTTRSSK